MKAINYLKKVEQIDVNISVCLEEVERLQALATKTTSVLGDERVQSSSSKQKMADCVDRIVDLQNEINKDIDRFVDYKQEALKILNENCDPSCLNLLYQRYFNYKEWEEIAVAMGCSYKWVSGGLHQRALAQFQKGLDERRTNEQRTEKEVK